MAYKALYRIYRPQNFDEVVGQKHILQTIRNAIKDNKIAHAYLFSGPRGTGKTTTAKIIAAIANAIPKYVQQQEIKIDKIPNTNAMVAALVLSTVCTAIDFGGICEISTPSGISSSC